MLKDVRIDAFRQFSAHASTSRAVPRSSMTRKPLPAESSAEIVGVSCVLSRSASCTMKSSLARMPIECWMSANDRA